MAVLASHHPFTPEQAEVIRAEWAAGTSTAQIGRLIGRTSGSVTGKAHRMGLPRRQDPIKRVQPSQGAVVAPESPERTKTTRTALSPLSGPEISSKAVVQRSPVSPARSCEWIDGQRGAYTKCGQPISRGSYCAEHGAICYAGRSGGAEPAD